MTTPQRLDNDTLIRTLLDLARSERDATAELLTYLVEVERRRLYADQGFASMFAFCCEALHMSEPNAYVRIHAARCCRRFPAVLQMLRQGELHLCAIRLLGPHLRDDNYEALCVAARHKSKRQVEQLVKDLSPLPDAKDAIRRLPPPREATPAQQPPARPEPVATNEMAPTNEPTTANKPAAPKERPAANGPATANEPASPPATPSTVGNVIHPQPLGQSRYKVQFTANEQLRAKIERAKDLLRNKNPTGDLAVLFEAAVDQLIQAESKRQHGATDAPRSPTHKPAEATKPSRYVPNHVKREVVERDGGQCTFISPDGRRCDERGGLQYHHDIPFAKGGPTTTANIRLLCSTHNALLARRDYGDDVVQERIRQARGTSHQTARPAAPETATGSSCPAPVAVAAPEAALAPWEQRSGSLAPCLGSTRSPATCRHGVPTASSGHLGRLESWSLDIGQSGP